MHIDSSRLHYKANMQAFTSKALKEVELTSLYFYLTRLTERGGRNKHGNVESSISGLMVGVLALRFFL